jgi:hypothetical protein
MALDAWSCCCASSRTVCADAFSARIAPLAIPEGYWRLFLVMSYLFDLLFLPYINFSVQGEKAKAIAVLEQIYDSDRLDEEVELLASASMHEFQSNCTGSYLDIFRSKELRLAFCAGAGLQV